MVVVVGLLAAAAPAVGQDVTGTWEFITAAGDRVVLVLTQDSAGAAAGTLAVGALRFDVRGVVEGGVLQGTLEGENVSDRFTARLLGTSLLWQAEGSTTGEYAFQLAREDDGPEENQPTSARGDPFAGTWLGAGMKLVLEGGAGTYEGTVTIAGERWSILARANGTVLICTIVGRGEAGQLTGVLSGEVLMLSGSEASALLHRSAPDSSEARRRQ